MVMVVVILPLVLPLAGFTLNHGFCAVLVATAVYTSDWLVLLPTVTICDAGEAAPTVYAKLSCVLLSVSEPEVTWSVTGIVTGLLATAVPPDVVAAMLRFPL